MVEKRPTLAATDVVALRCAECNRRIRRTDPRIVMNSQYVCHECAYFLDRGESPPNAKRNNQ